MQVSIRLSYFHTHKPFAILVPCYSEILKVTNACRVKEMPCSFLLTNKRCIDFSAEKRERNIVQLIGNWCNCFAKLLN
jgi:hypothetical protein